MTLLLAQTDAAATRTTYEFSRLAEMTQWSQWALLAAIVIAMISLVGWLYRRDTAEQARAVRWTLTGLRLVALTGLLLFFFNLEKKTESEMHENSRVVVLVDTSLSMALPNSVESGSAPRYEQIVEKFSQGELLESLRESHDVLVYQFDQTAQPTELAVFRRPQADLISETEDATAADARLQSARRLLWISFGVAAISLAAYLVALIIRRTAPSWRETAAVWSMVGAFTLVVAATLAATANLRAPELSLRQLALGDLQAYAVDKPAPKPTADEETAAPSYAEIDWLDKIKPRGVETRIGDAVAQIVQQERGRPIAGILLLTDGVNNGGLEIREAIQIAADSETPIFPIGLGPADRPINLRVVDLEAPSRVFPNDAFQITGYIQAFAAKTDFINVQLASGTTDSDGQFREETLEGEARRVQLGDDGAVIATTFDVTPESLGERTYQLRILSPAGSDQDTSDDQKTVKVQVIQRKNRVLLMAGGPSRDFRFLRNQLYRDKDVELHVYLQSGEPGISQESDELLFQFPEDAADLFENYDCIVAFDPDWSQLTLEQAELLERWVAEKAGGLIVTTGPVYTAKWASQRRGDPVVEVVKQLYPVTFHSRGTSIGLDRFGSEKAWPLSFTNEGQSQSFLWLGNDGANSAARWEEFPGVYGYYAVRDKKEGASVLSRYNDPDAALGSDPPIYMATQFYGAGRVFFMASSEMWRIRALHEGYFEQFYTKLIRYVSQGRLLRDSSRGVLLTNKDRLLVGETVEVRAHLTDAKHEPLTDPIAKALVTRPDGRRDELSLTLAEQGGQGQYHGQFTPLIEGDYHIELRLPGGGEDALLTRDVRVRLPDKEIERPERDDPVLRQIADGSGGVYYVGLDAALGKSALPAVYLPATLPPQDMYTALPDLVDRNFDRLLRTWLLGLICGALALEWLTRRLLKLA
ncbi:MAG: hypothetical protein ACIALR_12675 [Blastopirellula sp. JB062]